MKILSASLAAIAAAVSFSALAHANCESDYAGRYASGQPHRAFAMTAPGAALKNHNHGIAFSCSWAVNQPTRQIAIKIAMAHCESGRARRDERSACRVVNSQ